MYLQLQTFTIVQRLGVGLYFHICRQRLHTSHPMYKELNWFPSAMQCALNLQSILNMPYMLPHMDTAGCLARYMASTGSMYSLWRPVNYEWYM